MSSTAKQPADAKAADEPNTKKPKVGEPEIREEKDEKSTTTTTTTSNNNNNNNSTKIPTKTVNGNDKEPKQNEESEEGKFSDHDDDDDDDDDDEDGGEPIFDPNVAQSLNQVENIQLEICNLNEKASEEILKVEQKFNKLRRPHFEKRNELLKDIPNFWLTSLANHPIIAPMIESAEDEDCLHYMSNLDVEEYEDIKSGYKLKFHFRENPYITNQVITKEFQIVSSEEVVSGVSPIEYKTTEKGQALKQVVENSIAQNRRVRRPGSTQQSFFAWLVEPSESGTDEIAEILKDQIWPNPLEFFFATPEDYGAGTDDESDDEDEEIDDEELDDEEDGVIAEGNVGDFSDEEDGLEDEDDDDVEEI